MRQIPGRRAARPGRAARLARGATVLLLCLLAAVAAAGWPVGAVASCATADGWRSPWRFEGVASAVRSEQRIATVRTDDGRTVEVRGGHPRAMSSGDRTYQPGGRYEFHPLNASSPFEDNSCTATTLLFLGPVPPRAEPTLLERNRGVVPVAALAAGGLAVCLLGIRSRRRRARSRVSAPSRLG